jgi:hypothetical protein
MRSTAVLPLNDPDGIVFPHLVKAAPELKRTFDKIIIGLSAGTVERQPAYLEWLKGDSLFHVLEHGRPMPVGDQFRDLYTGTVALNRPEELLHLCFPDRLAFALASEHRTDIQADVEAIQLSDAPLLFQRSEAAWQTHPSNYRQLESLTIQLGQLLFGYTLEFAWCHLVVTAGQLKAALADCRRQDFAMMAELVLHLLDDIRTRDVDWLAWEDPFIEGRDPQVMKAERECSPAEVQKRLSYVLPMMEVLAEASWEDS